MARASSRPIRTLSSSIASATRSRSLAAHLDAATARLLDLIREFDARGGWGHGFRSCAHWLSWRVGLEPGAAREHVRVARALGSLPQLREALARVATPETEERLVAVGRAGTAERVELIVRGWRRMDRKAEAQETTRAASQPRSPCVSGWRRHGPDPRAPGTRSRRRRDAGADRGEGGTVSSPAGGRRPRGNVRR